MKLSKYYEVGRYAGKSTQERRAYYHERLKLFEKLVGERKNKNVLDAGCGDGGLAKLIKEQWGSDVWGADISKTGTSFAKKRGIAAKVADLSKLIPFDDSFFDLVIANELIEHLENPDRFLQEVHRILVPGGTLLVATPNLSFWLNRVLFFFGIYPLFLEASTEVSVGLGPCAAVSYGSQPVGHVHVYNLRAITELLSYHGFAVAKITGRPVYFVSPRSRVLTTVYRVIDFMASHFPTLAADTIIVAQKRKTV